MLDSFGKMAEAVMTFYNKTPLTAFLQIEGFEDSVSSGGKVDPAIRFFDNFNKSEKEFIDNFTSKESRKVEEAKKELDLENAKIKSRLESKQKALREAESELKTKRTNSDDEFIKEAISKMSILFFYPEINDEKALEKHKKESGTDRVRDNSQKNLEKAIAKYIHIFCAIYPDVPEKIFNTSAESKSFKGSAEDKKQKALEFIVDKFSNFLIKEQWHSKASKLHASGWPSFKSEKKIKTISANSLEIVQSYQEFQNQYHYQDSEGYRSRVSSTSKDDIKEMLIGNLMEAVASKFLIKENSKEYELIQQKLKKLEFGTEGDIEFKKSAIEAVEEFFYEEDMIVTKEQKEAFRKEFRMAKEKEKTIN